MEPLSSSRLSRLLTRASRADVVAFVADCYDARGWKVDGTAGSEGFTVRDPRTGRTDRVLVLGARTRFTAPDRVDADVVVARRDAGWARAVATASDARFLGPAELREQLLYGVGRGRARRLLADHFGAALERSPPRVRAETVAVTLALLVVVAGTAGGVTALFGADRVGPSDQSGPSSTTTPTATPTATPESGRPEPNTVSQFPWGVNDEGVQNVERLAAGHRAGLTGRAYTLTIEVEIRRSVGTADERVDLTRQTARVEDLTTYTRVVEDAEFTGENVTNGTDANATRVRFSQYADGRREYTRQLDSEGDPVYSSRAFVPERGSPFTRITTAYLTNHMDASRSELSRVIYRGREVYLASASGEPHRITGNVTDYRANAVLYPDGLVVDFEATYNITTNGSTRHVSVRFTYDAIDETTVTRPEWVDNVNGTTPVSGPD